MLKAIEQLLVLQDRDRKIRALKAELKVTPLEKKNLDEALVRSAAHRDAQKLKGQELEIARKKMEMEVDSKRATITKLNQQKFETRKNEEYQAYTEEIKRFEAEIRAIEDRELEVMESAESQRALIAQAEKDLTEAQALNARQNKNIEEKVQAIGVQLTEIDAERSRLATEVEEDLLDTYNRLFASKNDSAVVALEHEVCTGCHMKLTPSTAAKTKAGREIPHCEQCGRILYAGS